LSLLEKSFRKLRKNESTGVDSEKMGSPIKGSVK
jgi:hypothetical protein